MSSRKLEAIHSSASGFVDKPAVGLTCMLLRRRWSSTYATGMRSIVTPGVYEARR